MYMASFDTCPAAKTEWVFDLYGKIYGCTASCGREEYLLGTYWPEVDLHTKAIETWQCRDVTNIDECKNCKYDVICGGGCGVVAAGRNGGNPLAADCRPIQELLTIGVAHYKDEIIAMAEEDQPAADSACNGGAVRADRTFGCAVCGQELIYSDTPKELVCAVCGESRTAYIACPAGHYVCDACHGADILTQAQNLLIGSGEKDPVALAQQVFSLPALKMHGPEYHSLVPAILVTAVQNAAGAKDASKIMEAVRRGRDFKGGSCGLYGVCGAAAGAGIAYSVLEGATSMKKTERSGANEIAGKALIAASANVGPRCCKREAVTTILTFAENTHYFNGIKTTEYACSQAARNKDCIGADCPFFRAAYASPQKELLEATV
jgi:radical SAM protein with 4Fe4S-binding SPASM domain